MSTKERVVELLKAGVAQSIIADAVGCDPSYVSQIAHEPEITAIVAAARMESIEEDLAHDDMLDRAEMKALRIIEQRLPHANFAQALATYKTLNSATRRGEKGIAAGGNTTVGVVVNLTLPATAVPNYVRNANNEIIEVEGRTMVTANVTHIDALLKQREESRVAAQPRLPDLQKAANMLENLHEPAKLSVPTRRSAKLPAGLITPEML